MTTNNQGFTPGPWNFELSKEYGIVEGYDIWATNLSVALCDSKANARLIAAAPDMLEALRVLLDKAGKFEAGGMAFKHYFGEAVFNAHAAIAKATGE